MLIYTQLKLLTALFKFYLTSNMDFSIQSIFDKHMKIIYDKITQFITLLAVICSYISFCCKAQ